MKQGLLLINLGTPDTPNTVAVWNFLREFLSDKRVIDLPLAIRYLLLYGFILPFRTRKTTHAYQKIWTTNGSPLLFHAHNLVKKLQERMGVHCSIAVGMRYGQPSIQEALKQLQRCEKITILPLYPQYSSAATGSSIEKVLQLIASQTTTPSMNVIKDFHAHPSYIAAQAELISPYIAKYDYILFSYHGLPENHLLKGGCTKICTMKCSYNTNCYRSQCLKTTDLLAKALDLKEHQYGSSFQSRLGKTPWVKPYTDTMLSELIKQGIKRVAVVCPSFVADCLETLEEIGIRTKEHWIRLGGEQFSLVPCLNDSEMWLNAIIKISGLDSYENH